LRSSPLLFLVSLSCGGGEDCEDYSLDPKCLSETGQDTADAAVDTQEPDDLQTLEGTIAIRIVLSDVEGVEDNCSGTITVQYDPAAIGHELQGSFDCTWETPLGQQMAEAVGDGVMDGARDGEGTYSGHAWYGPIESDWSGAEDEAGLLSGAWSAHQEAIQEFGLPAMDHSGSFTFQLP